MIAGSVAQGGERAHWIGGAALAVALGALVGSPALCVGGPLVAGALAGQRRRRRRIVEECERELAVLGWIEAAARDLATGLALGPSLRARAVEFLGPSLPSAQTASGRELLAELDAAADPADEALCLVVVSLTVLLDHGGPAAVAVERLADTLRAREAARRLRRSQAAQARASAAVVAGIPAVFGSLAALVEPSLAHLYLWSAAGAACIGAALALSLAGFAWMEFEIERGAR